LARSRTDDVPAYVIFHDKTLEEIAAQEPASEAELAEVNGVGPSKLEKYGADVVQIVQNAAAG
jgi:superfamily II DNA helicase RecQ